jgi:hypothetical protein
MPEAPAERSAPVIGAAVRHYRQITGRNRTKTGKRRNLSLRHRRSAGLTSNNRACSHKSGSVNPSQSMSASLPKRPNCCVAAN